MNHLEFNGCQMIHGMSGQHNQNSLLTVETAEQVSRFFKTVNDYEVTPLVSLDSLARRLDVGKLYVKDESQRMGTDAFKVIGSIYSVALLICERLGMDIDQIDFDDLLSQDMHDQIKDMVFITATDGNHGKGIAWIADKLGCHCVVYMPQGTVPARIKAIEDLGATVHVTEFNYDDTFAKVVTIAHDNDWYLVQDQTSDNYTKIPNWIAQGYTLIAHEARLQMALDHIDIPTHIFLQAGAGTFAFGIAGYFADFYEGNMPHITLMEPDDAAGYFKSIQSGQRTSVEGDLETIMAGLSVGTPNSQAWELLRTIVDAYVSCPDDVSARGMRILSNPLGTDERVIAGESGSIGAGLLSLLDHSDSQAMRDALQLTDESVVLLFNTEGATDPDMFEHIVWDGYFSS